MERRKISGNIKTHRKLKNSSINREIGMLKNLARWGYKNRYLSSNYYDLVSCYPTTDSQKKRPFTDDEIQKILDNTTFPYLGAHILSIWHGLRVAEICYLERSDFVWSKEQSSKKLSFEEIDYLKVRSKPQFNWHPKTECSQRDIPIHPQCRDILYEMWKYGEGKSNFFLFTQKWI